MKKRIVLNLLVIASLIIFTGCSLTNTNDKTKHNDINEVTNLVKVIINENEYEIKLEDNETAKSFISMLPQEFNMSELNGNEKYIYLDMTLSTSPYKPGHINKGDVMLFGNNCLVIFYKSFNTSYNYTKIGHIDNLPDLGNSNITIKIQKN